MRKTLQNIALLFVVAGIAAYGVFSQGWPPSSFVAAGVIVWICWDND